MAAHPQIQDSDLFRHLQEVKRKGAEKNFVRSLKRAAVALEENKQRVQKKEPAFWSLPLHFLTGIILVLYDYYVFHLNL